MIKRSYFVLLINCNKADRQSKPVIMDFAVDREESVYPMVPAGAPITEMLLV